MSTPACSLSSRPSANHRIVLAAPARLGTLACTGLASAGLAGAGGVRPGHGRAGVVHTHNERAQRRVADHAERAGVDLDSLEHVEVHAQAVGNYRLDDVAV